LIQNGHQVAHQSLQSQKRLKSLLQTLAHRQRNMKASAWCQTAENRTQPATPCHRAHGPARRSTGDQERRAPGPADRPAHRLLHLPPGRKSSIYAGLLPSEEEASVLPVVRVNLDPLAALGIEIPNRYIFSVLLSFEENLPKDQRRPPQQLARMSLEEYLTCCPRPGGEDEEKEPEALIFDQFEEIITTDPTDREGKLAFFAELGAALRNRDRWALFAMRSYLPALDPYLRRSHPPGQHLPTGFPGLMPPARRSKPARDYDVISPMPLR
jgi:hypothetical protein